MTITNGKFNTEPIKCTFCRKEIQIEESMFFNIIPLCKECYNEATKDITLPKNISIYEQTSL